MKKNATYSLTQALVTTTLLFALSTGCENTSGETEELRAAVDSALSALADARLQTLSDATTNEFVAHPGKLDKKQAMRQLFVLFRINRGVFVSTPTPIIELGDDGRSARAQGPFIVTKRPLFSEDLVSAEEDVDAWKELASRYAPVQQAEISFVKVGESWKIDAARFY